MEKVFTDFRLRGTDKEFHSLSDFKKSMVVVLIFSCNHCPYAQAYVDRIRKFVSEYQDRGVTTIVINPNDASKYPQDSFQNMIPMSEKLGVGGLYLQDEDQYVAAEYGATVTPEVFVFDEKRDLKYHGAIDDNYENPDKAESHYLRDAVEAILKGNEPSVTERKARGCSIKWKEK